VKDETPFRYVHAEIRTQVVVICGPTRYHLDHAGAPVNAYEHGQIRARRRMPANVTVSLCKTLAVAVSAHLDQSESMSVLCE